MNIRIVSYFLKLRHAELVSAPKSTNSQHVINDTLKRVQGDVKVMTHCGHSIFFNR